jgi:hypothetical protein
VFFHLLDAVYRSDHSSEEEASDDSIHFSDSFFGDVFFGDVFFSGKHSDTSGREGDYFSIFIVFEKKLSFGIWIMMRFSSTVARILLKARFSGRMIDREKAPK